MDIQEALYIKQMELWIKEQDVIGGQLKRAVDYHDGLAASHLEVSKLNMEQLKNHNARVTSAKEEFENWKKDNEIGGETE